MPRFGTGPPASAPVARRQRRTPRPRGLVGAGLLRPPPRERRAGARRPAELGGHGRQRSARPRSWCASSPSTAARRRWRCRCTSTSPRSRRWRYRRELPGAEATLRRVADDGIVLVSTGGADFTAPRGQAVKVDGGYRVSGRKIFASQSPAGTVMSTMFPYDDPERGLRVLNMAVPFGAGVTVHDNWDTLGHARHRRATTSPSTTCSCPTRRCSPTALRRRRPAAPGDRQHRVLDRQRRLPRRRRVGRDARPPGRRGQGRRSDRAAAGRPDAAQAAGRRRGPTTARWPSSVTTRRRRWRRSPP